MSKETVLITGLSGWIAQFCAKEALSQGFKVKGSLRNMSRQKEVRLALEDALDNYDDLTFCKLDLLSDLGWDDAMQGCRYVLHVASPFVLEEPKNEQELIKPAKEGTLRCLQAAKKAKVKRVVVTSSIAAMMGHMKQGEFNENSWTDIKSKRTTFYQKSKTLAEQAAWEFYRQQTGEHKLELVVINPGAVFGPCLSSDLGGVSLNVARKLLTGKMPGIPNVNIVCVDVRDVAKHHLQAMVLAEAEGKRFISAHARPVSYLELATYLKQAGYELVTTRQIPTWFMRVLAWFNKEAKALLAYLDTSISCNNTLTRKLFNWSPVAFEQTVLDMGDTVSAVLQDEKTSLGLSKRSR